MNLARPSRAASPRAFTLIELLVVITIISVLVAVLLPTLAGARLAARQSTTLVRLRDIGVGLSAYMNDYRDRLPTLADPEEKPLLGLSLLSKVQGVPPAAFLNPNTTDTLADAVTTDDRPVLADLAGVEIDHDAQVTPANIAQVRFHCSFAFDNDVKPRKVWKPIVFLADRADYAQGRTFSANWKGTGMCAAWTDQHSAFIRSRTLPNQSDPNLYHHNEFNGEGGDESREGVAVSTHTLDTHVRYFSEEEDDALLPDAGP